MKKLLVFGLSLCLIMVSAPSLVLGTETTHHLEQNKPIEAEWEDATDGGTNKRPNHTFTFTMPQDGVFNLTTSRTGEGGGTVEFNWGQGGDNSGGWMHDATATEIKTSQYSLRAGTYTITTNYTVVKGTVMTISWFYSASNDTSWTGAVDNEPNDTWETAIPIAPDTVVTGNVNARDIYITGDGGNHDNHDWYKFTVTEPAEIELAATAIEERCHVQLWVSRADETFDAMRSSPHLQITSGGEWQTSDKIALEPGDYKIHIQGNNGSRYGLVAYELKYNLLTGSVGDSLQAGSAETPVVDTVTANPIAATVLVNGVNTAFDAYEINGNNYFKLRDLATVVNGTNKQFEVSWDGDKNAINLISEQSYTSVGGEMAVGDGASKPSTLNTSAIFKDGVLIELTAYTIDGNNYFKLRDIARAFDIGVTWDGTTSTIGVDTSIPYTE